jgi:NAD(P)-dependent dehydrogenase (short-subunit alcohol dehydrogenase family)
MNRKTVGRTVLITGAAGGLGRTLALGCAKAGFNVVMLDKQRKALENCWDDIVRQGFSEPNLHPLDLAVASPEQMVELSNALEAEFGGLDGLIHCAARFDGLMPLDQISPHEWMTQMQVNLNSAWLLSVSCLPLLRKSEAGFLYFLLENLTKVESAYWGSYGVSKHALKAMVRQFAAESKSCRLQVLGIDPGPMSSNLRAAAYHSENPSTVPAPTGAAEQILKLILGELTPEGTLVKLS